MCLIVFKKNAKQVVKMVNTPAACKTFIMMNIVMVFRKTTRHRSTMRVPHNPCQALGYFSDNMSFDADKSKVLTNNELQSPAYGAGR
jgi:S-adenosylmethionine synthetase